MLRPAGILALLLSLGLACLLFLRIRHERFAGPIEWARPDTLTFETVEAPEPLVTGGISLRALPPTLPADLQAVLGGTKSREWIGMTLRPPEILRGHAVKGAPVELTHSFLDLPPAGPLVGRTILKVGPAEWRERPWALWGTVAGISSLPCLLVTLAWAASLLWRFDSRRPPA